MDLVGEEQSKIQKICEEIRKNTIEPALKEAAEIEMHAKKNAEQILVEANEKKQHMLEMAQKEIEEKQKIFENALQLAKQRVMENIKQTIEEALFSKQFMQILQQHTSKKEVVAQIISALLHIVETQELQHFTVFVPEQSDVQQLAAQVGRGFMDQLQKKIIPLEGLTGGAKLKIEDKSLVIDLSDEAIEQLLAKFVRKEFRKILFK